MKPQNIYDNEKFFEGYKEIRENKDNYNELIEIPTIKSMLPDLKGKTVLDLGCGEAAMSRLFVKLGAKKVVALDVSENMINEAKKYNSKNIEFTTLPMEELSKIKGKFDFIFSSLAFHYIKDFKKLIGDISRLLKKGGVLLFSQYHPLKTAVKLEEGMDKKVVINNKTFVYLSDYNNEGERNENWIVDGVKMYHRNFETVINTLSENGFVIKSLKESKPTKQSLKTNPKSVLLNDRPLYLFIKAEKR